MPDWMMLNKRGLHRVDYDPSTKKYVETLVEDPLIYLRETCHLGQGFTVADLASFVLRHEELKRFISRYSKCREIDAFYAEIGCPNTNTDLTDIEIEWRAEICDYGSENSFSAQPHMHGCKGEENWYGLDFMSLGEYAHLPLKLNTEFKVYGNGEAARLLLQSTREFSLLDILDAFHWEISYFGGPEDRDKMAREAEAIEDELLDEEPFDDGDDHHVNLGPVS